MTFGTFWMGLCLGFALGAFMVYKTMLWSIMQIVKHRDKLEADNKLLEAKLENQRCLNRIIITGEEQ